MKSRYSPLSDVLRQSQQEKVSLSIGEIETALGNLLPASARERSWWSNREKSPQAAAWLESGYKVVRFDAERQTITFEKIKTRADYTVAIRENGIVAWDSELIKGLREHMGMTQAQFAEELGIRQQTVSEWEQGLYEPTRANAKYLMIFAEKAGFYKTE